MNYITQIIESIRVPNVTEVEKLHTSLKEDKRFDLKKFEYTHKEVKQKGEIIDEYELVKATLFFNLEKNPISHVKMNFEIEDGYFPEPTIAKNEEEIDF